MSDMEEFTFNGVPIRFDSDTPNNKKNVYLVKKESEMTREEKHMIKYFKSIGVKFVHKDSISEKHFEEDISK